MVSGDLGMGFCPLLDFIKTDSKDWDLTGCGH